MALMAGLLIPRQKGFDQRGENGDDFVGLGGG
jgi:hypothetical protein